MMKIGPLDKHLSAYQGGGIYDFDNHVLMTSYPERVLLHVDTDGSLLELGIGHGYSTDVFSRRFPRHVVLEGSSAVIENFRLKNPECPAEIIETYFERFSTTERFDVIVMGFVLEHVDEPVAILRRFANFLTDNGKMFVTVPNAEALNRRLGKLIGLLDDLEQLSQHDLLLGHKRYYSVATLRDDIHEAGYKIRTLEGIYLKPFTTAQILSMQLDPKVIEALCRVGIDYPELCCGLLAEISPR